MSSVCLTAVWALWLFHWFLSTPFCYLQWECSITNQLDICCPPFCGTCLVFFFPPTLRSCWVSPSAEKQKSVGSVCVEHFTPFWQKTQVLLQWNYWRTQLRHYWDKDLRLLTFPVLSRLQDYESVENYFRYRLMAGEQLGPSNRQCIQGYILKINPNLVIWWFFLFSCLWKSSRIFTRCIIV